MIACVFVLMMTGNVWTDQPKKPFSLQSLTGTSGVLIDGLGKLQITTDAWDVVAYVNLNDLNTKIDHLELAIAETGNLCKSKQLSSCHMHVQLFEKTMKRLISEKGLLENFLAQGRSKRGFLNIIGDGAKILFGTLSDADGQRHCISTNICIVSIPLVEADAYQIFKLTSVPLPLQGTKYICIVSIPLVEADAYQIFKLTSVPLPLQGTKYITLTLIKYPIVAINERSDLVITVSADEFSRFKRIGNKYFIGTSAQPISDEVTCETELIRPVPNLAPNCSKAILNVIHPIYLSIEKPNTWVYVLPAISHQVFSITCLVNSSTMVDKVTVNGSGIIQLSSEFAPLQMRDRCTTASKKADGGGVLVALDNTLTASVRLDWQSQAEDLWITVSVIDRPLHVCVGLAEPSRRLMDNNGSVTDLYEILYSLIDKYVPLYKRRSQHYPLWFLPSTIKVIKEKRKYHSRWKRYKNKIDYLTFSLLRIRSKHLIQDDLKTYINSVENEITEDPKRLWSYAKNKKAIQRIPNKIAYDGRVVSDGHSVSELFSEFFSSNFDDAVHHPVVRAASGGIGDRSLSSVSFSRDDILAVLLKLNKTKGPGPDGIPPAFILNCAYSQSSHSTSFLINPLLRVPFPRNGKKLISFPYINRVTRTLPKTTGQYHNYQLLGR
ncbi:Baculovirus F protein [Popillia japonica]|uniref:Baculovirus F protein n=1 Tax=Popillia japonica TaxID=7064 RepID=A0AAW1HTA6_POPJA